MDAYTVFPNRIAEPVDSARCAQVGQGRMIARRRVAGDRRRVMGDRRRPGGATVRYRAVVPRVSRAEHHPAASSGGVVTVLVTGLLTVATVLVLVGLAHLRAADVDSAVPKSVGVVQVHSGEGLGELAHRIAPEVGTGVMVERIMELNGLTDSTVRQGQQLLVPLNEHR